MHHHADPAQQEGEVGALALAVDGVGSLPGFLDRLQRLRTLDLSHAVTGLILDLEQLSRASLDAETRFQILHVLKRAVLHVTAALPESRPTTQARVAGAPPSLTLAQRLNAAMANNCLRLVHELGRGHNGHTDSLALSRQWAVRNTFFFIGRQLLDAVRTGYGWPPGAWQCLHELFVYLVMRGSVRLHGGSPAQGKHGLDPEYAYKRLLLIGLLAELVGSSRIHADTLEQLCTMVAATRLVQSDGLVGEFGLILVEVSHDRPPRLRSGSLDDPFRGWVLRVPREFASLVRTLDPSRPLRLAAVA